MGVSGEVKKRRSIAWWAGRTIVCVALGVLTIVCVAWGSALWARHAPADRRCASIGDLKVEEVAIGLGVRRGWVSAPADGSYPFPLGDIRSATNVRMGIQGEFNGTWRSWAREEVDEHGYWGIEDAHGWPWVALWGRIQHDPSTGAWSSRSGAVIVSDTMAEPIALRFLPLLPVWNGFAADVMVFGFAWAVVWLIAASVAHLRRTRAGKCPECRYDLAGQAQPGCPECGWGRDVGPMAPTVVESSSVTNS